MLTNILIVASALAQAYATPPSVPGVAVERPARAAAVSATPAVVTATPGRMLKDLPGTTIVYYDIAGTTMPEIQLSLQTVHANPANKDAARLYTWDVGTRIQKATTGTKCTVQGATTTLTAKVRLPRLAEQAKVQAPVMANWTAYASQAENQAAADLWFLTDRLRGAEKFLIGMPCEQAGPAWNAKLATVRSELSARSAQRAAAEAAAAAAAAVPKPAG